MHQPKAATQEALIPEVAIYSNVIGHTCSRISHLINSYLKNFHSRNNQINCSLKRRQKIDSSSDSSSRFLTTHHFNFFCFTLYLRYLFSYTGFFSFFFTNSPILNHILLKLHFQQQMAYI